MTIATFKEFLSSRALLVAIALYAGLSCLTLQAQIYSYEDENGNTVYTDTPPTENAEPVDLPEIIYQPAVDVPESFGAQDESEEEAQPIRVSISAPVQGHLVTVEKTSFSVTASTSRPLEEGETARFLVNSRLHTQSQALSWQVGNLVRGPYLLSVEIVDANGKTLASTGVTEIFVRRPIFRPG